MSLSIGMSIGAQRRAGRILTLVSATPANTSVTADSITKNSSNGVGDGSANSVESFAGDFSITFTVSTIGFSMGFISETIPATGYQHATWGIYFRDDGIYAPLDNGVLGTGVLTYVAGDVFKIARIGSEVVRYKNGVEVLTRQTIPTAAMFFDTWLYTAPYSLTNIGLGS